MKYRIVETKAGTFCGEQKRYFFWTPVNYEVYDTIEGALGAVEQARASQRYHDLSRQIKSITEVK